jgi:hypothetical protein
MRLPELTTMNPLMITLITASSALVAGIAGPIVSISVARRQIRAMVISNNRERWIEALRDALAEYVAVAASAALIGRDSKEDLQALVGGDHEFRQTAERMLLFKSKIPLMTNTKDEFDRELQQSIETVHTVVVSRETLTLEQWGARLDAVTVAGHAVLRAAWTRVKRGD